MTDTPAKADETMDLRDSLAAWFQFYFSGMSKDEAAAAARLLTDGSPLAQREAAHAAEIQAREAAEARASRDYWQVEARLMVTEANLIDLARMYGEACGEHARFRASADEMWASCKRVGASMLEYKADRDRLAAENAALTTPRPIAEYHEDHGFVLWWILPVCEPPYSGSPLCDDWPGYHTHWTPLPEIQDAAWREAQKADFRAARAALPEAITPDPSQPARGETT